MDITLAELQGVVAGLIGVVKDLTTNVNHVTQNIGEIHQAVAGAPNPDETQGLACLPCIQLPSFRRDSVVQDNISEVLERFTQQTSAEEKLNIWLRAL